MVACGAPPGRNTNTTASCPKSPPSSSMESIGVLMTVPVNRYLEEALDNRFKLFRFWTTTEKSAFLATHKDSIRAVVSKGGSAVDSTMIDALPKLEIVANHGVGLDKIDLGKCKEKGIRVTYTPDVLSDDVADLALGLMLAVLRKVCASDRYVRTRMWKKGKFELTTKLTGKAVGIIGLGRIGMAIARRVEAFSCPISYHSRTQKPEVRYKFYPSVVELAANSHILVVACELTDETRHIINRRVVEALGPEGIVINIGRGGQIDETELVSALVECQLGGAGLDVFEHEPHVAEELLGLDNVVVSPHVGTATVETRKAMAELVLGNLEAYFLRKPLLTPVCVNFVADSTLPELGSKIR